MATFRTVHLHGAAEVQFGGPYRLAADTPRDAIRALLRLKPGFRKFVEQADWRIVRGPLGRGIESDLDMLNLRFGRVDEMHLIPVASGSAKGKAIGKVVVGMALIAASIVTAGMAAPAGVAVMSGGIAVGVSGGGLAMGATAFSVFGASITFANIAMVGAGLVLGGVSQLLAPNPKVGDYGSRESANNRPSFLFNGPVNVAELGNVIPIVYGRDVEVGTVVGAAGIYVEEIPAS